MLTGACEWSRGTRLEYCNSKSSTPCGNNGNELAKPTKSSQFQRAFFQFLVDLRSLSPTLNSEFRHSISLRCIFIFRRRGILLANLQTDSGAKNRLQDTRSKLHEAITGKFGNSSWLNPRSRYKGLHHPTSRRSASGCSIPFAKHHPYSLGTGNPSRRSIYGCPFSCTGANFNTRNSDLIIAVNNLS